MDLPSIADVHKKGFGVIYREKVVEAVSSDWVFSGWERPFVSACVIWSVFSLIKFLRGLF